MKKFVTAVALLTGMALASGAAAQSSGTSSPPSGSSSQPSSGSSSSDQSQSSASQAQSSSSTQTGVLVDANSIIGATVRAQGKDIGKVERLMVDPKDGRVRTVVVQQGGTLGMGGKSVSIPWESVKVGQDGDKIIVTAEQQMLEQAPAASPRTDSKSDSSKDSSKSDSKK
jgi:sporulation protein YlmC with PRC-barrel domain